MKKYLRTLTIYIYSTIICFRINNTLFFPVYINNELLYISLTKVKSSYYLLPTEDKFSEKITKIFLSYTLGYNFNQQIKLINVNNFEEGNINIKDIIQENFQKV